MKTLIFESYEDFESRYDKSINGVSREFAEKHGDWYIKNAYNTGCWNCIDCANCVECRGCSMCIDCRLCINCQYCIGYKECTNRVFDYVKTGVLYA